MMTADQPQSETPRRKRFQDSVRILVGITSWHLWSSILMMVLLAGAIGLLLFRTLNPSLPVLGLLVLVCLVSSITLRRQYGKLKLLREGLIEQMDSIIKQRAKTEQFYGMATQDALTGLYNRRFGETRLQEEIARAEKSREPLILIAADFDKFKQINDQYGHAAGDLALKEFSRQLQRAVRACDVPIRVGGDEFLVIFPECVLEKIPEIMSRMGSISFPFEGKKIPVSFSYGAAQYQPHDTPESMLKRADERLYAKKAKRKAAEAGSGSVSRDANAPKAPEAAAKPNPSPARSLVAEAGFRRSERVPFEMPVEVYLSRENEEPVREEAKTLSVNAHGALLRLSMPVEMGQALRLVNPRTQQEMECRVCRFGELHEGDMKEVAIEFAAVTPTFWDVPSVPADWDPAWVPQQNGGCRQLSPFANAAPPVAPEAAISHLFDDVEKGLRSSSPAEWNPPWAPRPESGRQQVSISNNAAPAVPLSAEALSVLCDNLERVVEGSRPLGNNPQRAARRESEAREVSGATRDVAPAASTPIDTVSVVWDDSEMVKDVSRLVGLDPTWVPEPDRGLPKVSLPEDVPPELPIGPADLLQVKGQEIIKEALQNLKDSTANSTDTAKAANARTPKWLILALAFSVVLMIAVGVAMPHKFSGVAASADTANRARSSTLSEGAAGMTSSPLSGSTVSGLSQAGLPTGEAGLRTSSQLPESTVLGTHPCAAAEAAPGFSTEMAQVMPRVPGFRLAIKADFDPEAVAWLQNEGQQASGKILGDYTGSGEYPAYLWVGKDKSWQVVIPAPAQRRCDASLPSVAIAARVSKESINRIQWDGPAPEPSGDGLLIVRSAKDPASGVIFSLRGNDIVGSRPADYRQVPLGERNVAKTDSQ